MTRAAMRIAGEMLAAIVSDNDMFDVADRAEQYKAKLAETLESTIRKEGVDLFTDELITEFAIGEDREAEAIIAEYPELKTAHDLLNEFFEEPDKMTGGTQ